jgi:hypothetical protein
MDLQALRHAVQDIATGQATSRELISQMSLTQRSALALLERRARKTPGGLTSVTLPIKTALWIAPPEQVTR